MKNIILANFKMNTTIKEFSAYCDAFFPKATNCKNTIGFALPYTHLMFAEQKFTSTGFMLGAQNVFYEDAGAYTGEISPKVLKELGTDFVLIGHSERRKLGENNETINKKVKRALAYNLKIVLCVGETKAERASGKIKSTLKKQIDIALKGLYENELKNIIIAYEPVWAIGTGLTPTSKQIEETVLIIREIIKADFSEKAASKINVIYGGSANASNCKALLKINGVNGLLVGGASLNASEFAQICM